MDKIVYLSDYKKDKPTGDVLSFTVSGEIECTCVPSIRFSVNDNGYKFTIAYVDQGDGQPLYRESFRFRPFFHGVLQSLTFDAYITMCAIRTRERAMVAMDQRGTVVKRIKHLSGL